MTSPLVGTGIMMAGFLIGAVPPGLFTLHEALAARLGWDTSRGERWWRSGFFLSTVILLPFAGWATDLWGPREPAILGLLALTLGLALLALFPNPATARTNLLGIALGLAFAAVGCIVWVPTLLSPPGRAVEGLNLGFIPISLGWLTAPWLVRRSTAVLGLRAPLLVAAGIAGISLLLLLTGDEAPNPGPSTIPLTQDLRFWLLALTLLLYFPVESCLEVWSEPFLRDLGRGSLVYSKTRLVGFWVIYLLARLAAFWALRTGTEPWFLLTCVLASAMILGNLVGAYGPSSGGWGFWLVGACYGPLLPGLLGMMCDIFPARQGIILGMMLSLGSIYHGMLWPILQQYATNHTSRQAMRIPVFLTLILAAPLLLVIVMR